MAEMVDAIDSAPPPAFQRKLIVPRPCRCLPMMMPGPTISPAPDT